MPTALEILVENRLTGFPFIDDEWKLVRFAYPLLNHPVFFVDVCVLRTGVRLCK
jgi:hypothetical protein